MIEKCPACLEVHTEEEGCKCASCGVPMHPLFIRCVIVDGERKAWCPHCDDARIEAKKMADALYGWSLN